MSVAPELRAPLVIAAHDAGGAEVLSSLVRREGLQPRYSLAGPALAVFQRKLGPIENLSPDAALAGAATLLAGTGWQSTHEWQAIRAARAAGVRTIAFLDHWVNYRERFVRDGATSLPDEVWVGDEDALALARRVLPECPATLVPNPYFTDMREELAAAAVPNDGKGLRVLYVCEPMREPAKRQFGNERHHGYVEEEALAFALDALAALDEPIARVTVRPHPSEAPDKYDAQLAGRPWPVRRGGAASLLHEVADSDLVVGCNSVAMVVGLLGGKRVYSAIPPGGAACVLPQRAIRLLREAVSAG